MTVGEWLARVRARLTTAGIEAPALEAQLLAAQALGVERTWLHAHVGASFPEFAGETLVQRREAQEPLAYILGYREFFGRRFAVDNRVLIPRQETETLVETVLRIAPEHARVLDLGTGSGCVAVSLKLERPDLEVLGTDVSADALEVAQANARELGAAVEFRLSDRFENLLGEAFDVIATNPPYVGMREPLSREVGQFEPELALYGGESGDEFLTKLALEAKEYLKDGGKLVTEVGYQQAERSRGMFVREGWRHLETVKDLAGIERVLAFEAGFECV